MRIPTEPQNVGDHIRRRRLRLKLLQRDVAERIGVHETTVFNWEANTSTPDIRYVPAIIRFLGYNPLPEAKTQGEELVWHRTTLGLSQKQAASKLGIDPGTLARRKRGERETEGLCLTRVHQFLAYKGVPYLAPRRAG